MKRFTKVMLIIAGVFVIVGLGFSIGGVAMGATVESVEAVQEMKERFWHVKSIAMDDWDDDWDDWDDDWDDDDDDDDGDYVGYTGSGSEDVREYQADPVDEVEIDLRYDELILQAYDGDTIKVAVENDKTHDVKIKSDSHKLEIKSNKKVRNRCVTISYPRNKEFSKMELEVDAGSIEIMDELKVRELDVTVGAGEFTNEAALTADKADIEVGTGNVEITGLTADKIDGECGLGNMELEIIGKQTDYNYKLECGMGNISINGESYSSILGSNKIQNGNTSKNIELECGMGNISIEFEEE